MSILKKLRNLLFPQLYETRGMLENYMRAQYGPFLIRNSYLKSEPFYQSIIEEARQYFSNQTHALDVGCAVGRLVFEYSQLGIAHASGIDSSKRFIDACNKISKNKNTTYIHGDILKQPPKNVHYSFISCINVLDRVAQPTILVDVLYNLLTPEGILLLVDPYDWRMSPASKRWHVRDMKSLLDSNRWDIKKERKNLEYVIPTDRTHEIMYSCHLIIAQKRYVLVDRSGFEPLTPSLQMRCSTAELTALFLTLRNYGRIAKECRKRKRF